MTRSEFHGQLFAWDSLALVAQQNPVLERELEDELAANPHLRTWPGPFLWNVRKGYGNSAAVLDALPHFLREGDYVHNGMVYCILAEPQRLGLRPEELLSALEETVGDSPEAPALELLAALFPDHPTVLEAWRGLPGAERTESADAGVNPRTYFALAYAVTSSDEIVEQIARHHGLLRKFGIPHFHRLFARHVSHRLRRDSLSVRRVREAIRDPGTPDALAAVLASLLGSAVGVEAELLTEIEHRINGQNGRALATVVRDPHSGSSLPVRAVLLGVAEGERESRVL